jgi:Na+-driven multidrug efflux pump
MAALTQEARSVLAWALRVAALLLLTWFVLDMLRPGWDGTGNPMWPVFVSAMALGGVSWKVAPAGSRLDGRRG